MRHIRSMRRYPPLPAGVLEENRARLEELGKKHHLTLLYAHGSVVDGTMGLLSDVDIAVKMAEDAPDRSLFALGALSSDLSEIFGREDIDLADLEGGSPLLRYLVAARGRCLYARSDSDRVAFEFTALRDYLDTIPLRHLVYQGMASAIAAGKFYP